MSRNHPVGSNTTIVTSTIHNQLFFRNYYEPAKHYMDIINLLFLQQEITDLQKESDNGTLYISKNYYYLHIKVLL